MLVVEELLAFPLKAGAGIWLALGVRVGRVDSLLVGDGGELLPVAQEGGLGNGSGARRWWLLLRSLLGMHRIIQVHRR